jgi:hypothetical protein
VYPPEQQPPYPGDQQPYQQQQPYQAQPQQPYPGPEYPQQQQPYVQQEYYQSYGGQPPYQAPPPVSSSPPASVPPSSVPPASVPPSSVPPGYPAMAAPAAGPAAGRPRPVTPMIIVTAALGLVLVVSLVLVLVSINGLHRDIAAVRADLTSRQAADAQAQAKLRDDFQKADLQGKLSRVRELTTAAREALIAWGVGRDVNEIKTVQDAINKCDVAILDYDAAAAEFPADLLGDLPSKINTRDRDTNCSRIIG